MTQNEQGIFNRVERLLGSDNLNAIQQQRVIIFGVGGVGSWCAESLVRSGIRSLTLVDSDRVALSNVNRQLMATTQTVGQVKVEALRNRLLAINPDADITAVCGIYSSATAGDYDLSSYDFVIDAIDSLQDKITLILNATAADCHFFSSMGAALKMDPQKIRVAEFFKIEGCPLARAIRKRLKHMGKRPSCKFSCVYSPEVLPNLGTPLTDETNLSSYADPRKAQVNGTLAHTTAIFGFTLASLVMQKIMAQ